jgi:hypothetical protein
MYVLLLSLVNAENELQSSVEEMCVYVYTHVYVCRENGL